MESTNKNILLGLAIKHQGNWEEIYYALQHKEYEGAIQLAEDYTGYFITILDKEYPECLKQGFKPPFVLFYKGDISLLNNGHKHICVATNRNTDIGTISYLQALLNNNYKDIDYIVNEKLNSIHFDKSHHIICVAGSGLDLINSAQYDLVISEYPNGVEPQAEHYQIRNRIMANLCTKILVGKVGQMSGNNVLVMFGMQGGKDVIVMPVHPFENDNEKLANNKLIYDGAIPLLDVGQLAE